MGLLGGPAECRSDSAGAAWCAQGEACMGLISRGACRHLLPRAHPATQLLATPPRSCSRTLPPARRRSSVQRQPPPPPWPPPLPPPRPLRPSWRPSPRPPQPPWLPRATALPRSRCRPRRTRACERFCASRAGSLCCVQAQAARQAPCRPRTRRPAQPRVPIICVRNTAPPRRPRSRVA